MTQDKLDDVDLTEMLYVATHAMQAGFTRVQAAPEHIIALIEEVLTARLQRRLDDAITAKDGAE